MWKDNIFELFLLSNAFLLAIFCTPDDTSSFSIVFSTILFVAAFIAFASIITHQLYCKIFVKPSHPAVPITAEVEEEKQMRASEFPTVHSDARELSPARNVRAVETPSSQYRLSKAKPQDTTWDIEMATNDCVVRGDSEASMTASGEGNDVLPGYLRNDAEEESTETSSVVVMA
jgi:hypothetical protein